MAEMAAGEEGLRRVLNGREAAAFVITNMVGAGIFTLPAFVRSSTGSGPASLAIWALGGGLALCGALCFAELATRFPEAGGEYQYLSRLYGRMWGFVSGLISFLAGFSAAIGASALGASAYALSAFGLRAETVLIEGSGLTLGSVTAALLILGMALFHCLGVKSGGRLQSVIAGMVVGGILLLTIAGLLSGRGDWSGLTAGSPPSGAWWVALIQVSFAYSGWNAAAYLAGEVKDPQRTLPRALIGGTAIVTLLYLGLNLLFLYAIPAGEWQPTIAIGRAAAERLFGTNGALAVSAIVAVTIVGSVSAMTAAGPRVYYAMAADRLAPAILARVSRRRGTPVIAIMAQASIAILLVLTGEFETLLIYIGAALSLIAAMAVSGVWLARRRSRSSGAFLTPGYPFTPAIFLILELTAFLLGLRERPKPTGAALATILAGIVIYLIIERLNHRKERSNQ